MWEQLGNRLMQKGEKGWEWVCVCVPKWVCMCVCDLRANSKANKRKLLLSNSALVCSDGMSPVGSSIASSIIWKFGHQIPSKTDSWCIVWNVNLIILIGSHSSDIVFCLNFQVRNGAPLLEGDLCSSLCCSAIVLLSNTQTNTVPTSAMLLQHVCLT